MKNRDDIVPLYIITALVGVLSIPTVLPSIVQFSIEAIFIALMLILAFLAIKSRTYIMFVLLIVLGAFQIFNPYRILDLIVAVILFIVALTTDKNKAI